MSVFAMYIDRAEEFYIEGKGNELIATTRKGRSVSVSSINNDKFGLLQDNSNISNGDLVTNIKTGIKYFVIGKQRSTDAVQVQLSKCNATVDIVRLAKQYINGNYTGHSIEQLLHSNVPAIYQDITGKMQQFDSGLLSTSTRRFILPGLSDVMLLDRIKLNSDNGQVDVINTSMYENLHYIQISSDKRRVVSS